jgi:hypothetical protein
MDRPTDAVDSLIAYLRRLATLSGPAQAGHRYGSTAELVLLRGATWLGSPLPARVRRGPANACFANAARLALTAGGFLYVEGWAVPAGVPVPLEHAWCVDASTGEVADPTWKRAGTAYAGVALSAETLAEALGRTQTYGVLANDWKFGRYLLRYGLPAVDKAGSPIAAGAQGE